MVKMKTALVLVVCLAMLCRAEPPGVRIKNGDLHVDADGKRVFVGGVDIIARLRYLQRRVTALQACPPSVDFDLVPAFTSEQPTYDTASFTLDEDLYLILANRNVPSVVYRWTSEPVSCASLAKPGQCLNASGTIASALGGFEVVQELEVATPLSVKAFDVEGTPHLFFGSSAATSSPLFRWDFGSGRFEQLQTLPAVGSKGISNCDVFTGVDGSLNLALANLDDRVTVFRFDSGQDRFVSTSLSLTVVSPFDFEAFRLADGRVLFAAPSYWNTGLRVGEQLSSTAWGNTYTLTEVTDGAREVLFINATNGQLYLVVTAERTSVATDSQVFWYNPSTKALQFVQSLPTERGVHVSAFHIGDRTHVAITNYGRSPYQNVASFLYSLNDGTGQFELMHRYPSRTGTSSEYFATPFGTNFLSTTSFDDKSVIFYALCGDSL